jgi:acyl dehydratase
MNTDTLSDQPVSPYVVHGVAGLRERAGSSLGTSRWVTVDQEMVTTFADLTGDRQWIHVDPERSRTGSLPWACRPACCGTFSPSMTSA